MYKNIPGFLLVAIALISLGGCAGGPATLVLATTTSTADSGLLDDLLPPFQAANNVRVEVVAVGTGQAMALGERGDADVLLVHDRTREDEFVARGYGVGRKDVMYNDFVVIGPADDPAGIMGSPSAAEAFARIARAGSAGEALFVSRGDKSGTHAKELQAWKSAGIEPSGKWYRETGQGMGDTLTVANEMRAYTLADRGTYLSRREGLALILLAEGDKLLFNPYGIIAVNPERYSHVKYDLAVKLIEYLTSYQTQERIGEFGRERYGQPLFYPNSQAWRAQQKSP